MIDTHCHLDYLENPDKSINNSMLSNLICIGASKKHAQESLKLANKYSKVWFTSGIHPLNAKDFFKEKEDIEKFLLHKKCVAIGECGIDMYHNQDFLDIQKECFIWQLELAKKYNKPIIIHVRDRQNQDMAHQEIINILQNYDLKVILHCFSGNKDMLKFGKERDYYFSFAGNLTYKNAKEIQESAKLINKDRLLIETDAPFLAPVPHRGKKNIPEFVQYTLAFLQDLRQEFDLNEATTQNAKRIFNIN